MAKKKKDHIASTSQETNTHEPLNKEDPEPPLVPPTDMPKQNYPNSSNKEHTQILQWPSTTQQPIMEHYPFPSISSLSLQQQLRPTVHHVQHSKSAPNLAQPALPFCLPPWTGYPFPGTNDPGSFQLFTPNGTTCGEKLAVIQTHVPKFCNHIGYPFPAFPGPWDPSRWNQTPQSQSPCTYTFPGACGYHSQPVLPVPRYPVAFGQTAQKGIIRPHIKLSRKHRQLWEAQVHVAQGTRVASTGQAPKRGMPRKSVATVTLSPSPNESLRRSCGKKAVKNRRQGKISEHNFEKQAIDNVEEKGKSCQPSGNIWNENDGDNPKIPELENHGQYNIPEVHANLTCPNMLEVASSVYKGKDTNISRRYSSTCLGTSYNGVSSWPLDVSSRDYEGHVLNPSSQGYHESGSNGIKQGRIMVCRWNYDEDAYTLEDGKEAKREEEMEEDASSDTENCTSQA